MSQKENIDKTKIEDAQVKDIRAFSKKAKMQSETLKRIISELNNDKSNKNIKN